MRASHAHVHQNLPTIFFSSRLSVCPSKGFSKAFATHNLYLLVFRPVYMLILYGLSLLPFPVTLVEGLREIEGRAPLAMSTLLL